MWAQKKLVRVGVLPFYALSYFRVIEGSSRCCSCLALSGAFAGVSSLKHDRSRVRISGWMAPRRVLAHISLQVILMGPSDWLQPRFTCADVCRGGCHADHCRHRGARFTLAARVHAPISTCLLTERYEQPNASPSHPAVFHFHLEAL